MYLPTRLYPICKIILSAILIMFPSFVKAQQKVKPQRIIYGNVVDNVTRKNLVSVPIYRLLPDSSVVDSSFTSRGNNVMDSYDNYFFFVPKEGGDWIFRVAFQGYETLYQKVHVPSFNGRQMLYHLPDMILKKKPREVKLAGAVVKATKIKFYTRGDTLVYNADAFNLSEGSMLDALIRQLPGAEIKDDGEIFVNGQKVESLLLNGEDFFKNNRQLMLDNLPAYTVKDVQVYRKRGKLAEWANHDLGEKELVMDVKLKKEYRTGWLANIEAGTGSKNRYLARFFAMRFTDHSNLSFFGNMNNLNDSRRPGQDGSWTPDKMPSGLQANKLIASSYQINDRQKRYKLHGDAQLNHSDGDFVTSTTGENFLPAGNTFLHRQNSRKSRSTGFTTSHDWLFGRARQEQEISWNFNYQNWHNHHNDASATFEKNPFGYGNALLDSIRAFNAGSLLRKLALNRQLSELLNNGHNYSFSFAPNLHFKSIATDIIAIEASVEYTGRKENTFSNLLYDFPKESATNSDFRRQWNDQHEYHQNYSLDGGYYFVFPNNLVIMPSYAISHQRSRNCNPLYRLDKEDGWGAQDFHPIGSLPSETDFLLHTLDTQNSSWRHSVQTDQTAELGASWNSIRNSEKLHWEVDARLPIVFSHESMDYRQADYNGKHTRHLTYCQPQFNIDHYWNEHSVGWNFKYRLNYRTTDMVNFLEIEQNADPLNTYNGNPNQKNTTTHYFSFYTFHNYKKAQSQWDAYFTYTLTQNAQAMAYTLDRNTGVRHYTPDNVNGNYLLNANIGFSLPLDKLKRLTFELRSYAQYTQNVDMISNNYTDAASSLLPQRSSVHTTWITENLKLGYKIGQTTLGAKGYLSWNKAQSNREGFRTVQVWDFNYGLTALTQLPWDLQLSTDLTMYSRRGYDNPSSNTNDLVWNTRLAKRLMHGSMTFALDGFDILGQLSNLTQTMNSQGRFETYRNALPRYIMAHLIYPLNIKPKQKQPAK